MIQRVRLTMADFPREFWILFGGTLVNAAGSGLVFPFFTLYVRQRFGIPMVTIGAAMSVMAGAGLASGAVGGALADRFGRKKLMIGGLTLGATALFSMGLVDSVGAFVGVAIFMNLISPVFGPASQAMISDLVEPGKRARAYGLIRVAFNLGVAIGPAIGGFLAERSYFILFASDAITSLIFAGIILFFIAETRPEVRRGDRAVPQTGYGPLLRDTPFVLFCLVSVAVTAVYAQMNSTWPVFMKENYGILERQYGLMMSLSAAMVVLFQFPITGFTERYGRATMLAWGTALYAIGFGLVGFVSTAPLFTLALAIWTVGEMVHVPVSQAYVADVAPEDMRGRYMGAAGLTWGIGWGIGPFLAGLVMDRAEPHYVWYGCLVIGLAAAMAFLGLGQRQQGAGNRVLDDAAATT
ncbi:MAG: MFS transporter [Anaerolineae bacterium]|jgi:MFS family permease